jgi:hypothetical protein
VVAKVQGEYYDSQSSAEFHLYERWSGHRICQQGTWCLRKPYPCKFQHLLNPELISDLNNIVWQPRFAQIYILDPANELQNRMDADVHRGICMRQLQDMVHRMNPFLGLLKMTYNHWSLCWLFQWHKIDHEHLWYQYQLNKATISNTKIKRMLHYLL